jgi:hypothetical protein
MRSGQPTTTTTARREREGEGRKAARYVCVDEKEKEDVVDERKGVYLE